MSSSYHRQRASRWAVGSLVVAAVSLAGSVLSGQTSDHPPPFVAGRLGANFQETDPEGGTSVGRGGSVAFFLSPRWAMEFEAWIPTYIKNLVPTPRPEPGQFRDLLFGVSALRSFGDGGVQPFVLVGIALSRTEYRPTSSPHWATTGGYGQAGGGFMVRLSSRFAVAPEFRLNVAPLSIIVRPTVAVIYHLR
jgi:hypothetical protein